MGCVADMNWKIAVDSSSDLQEGMDCAPGVSLSIVPLTIQVDGMSFVDAPGLDIRSMMDAMRATSGATSSACPSPDAWASVFEEADYTFAITISSNLSGAYNSAMIARDIVMEKYPDKKIAVIDSYATSGQMILLAYKINELIAEGLSFEEIIHAVEAACGHEIPYVIDPRRPGDIAACWADTEKARRLLGWQAARSLEQMCRDSWNSLQK